MLAFLGSKLKNRTITQFERYKNTKEVRYTINMGDAEIKSPRDGPARRLQTSMMGIEMFIMNFDIELSEDSSKILHLTHKIPMATKKAKTNSCCKIIKNCAMIKTSLVGHAA